MMNTMNNTMTMNAMVVKAAREAGIKAGELFTVEIIGTENGICEMNLGTEWNTINCFVDLETEEVLGIMATARTMDEVLIAA